MTVLIVVLLALCVLLAMLVLSSELRRRSATETIRLETRAELERWGSELKGRYETILTERQRQADEVAREREVYKTLLVTWSERISAINESLSRIDQQAVETVGDLAGVLKPIASIFRSPQAAGIEFGETTLELLLKSRLGASLYVRKPRLLAVGQEVVDFALTLPGCLIPIDSKFPSASYRAWVEASSEVEAKGAWRTFRDQILEQLAQTAKYIKPDAGTADYALLFVPSDVIYQQAFLTTALYGQTNPIPSRSQELQVFGCSTQTLMPYLGLIRLGLRNLKIAEDIKGVRGEIEQLDVVWRTFSGDWDILRRHVDQLAKHVERLSSGRGAVAQLGERVTRLSGPQRFDDPHHTGDVARPVSEAVSAAYNV